MIASLTWTFIQQMRKKHSKYIYIKLKLLNSSPNANKLHGYML